MGGESLLGVIPDGWQCTTLGVACGEGGGNIQTGPFGSQLHASDYVDEGIPSVMPVNIGDSRILTDGICRITEADAQRLSRYRLLAGDIVYSRRGDVERLALVRDQENGWLCGTGCLRVRFGKNKINPLYASYYLGHPSVRQWVVQHAIGATMPNLNTGILSALPFLCPPLPVQHRIADILGSLDDKIELNRRTNETLEAMAKAIFKSWFVDFDPVVAKSEGRQPEGMDAETAKLFPSSFKDSEIGRVPQGWKVRTVGEVFNVTMGQSPPGSTYNGDGDGLPFYQGRRDFGFRYPVLRVYCNAPTRIAQRGDSLVSVRAPVGDINMAATKCCIGRGVAAVRHRTGSRSYTYYSMHDLQPSLQQYEANGTVFGAINKNQFQGLAIVDPSDAIVRTFEHMASAIDDEIGLMTTEADALSEIRDTLLPRLLSGEFLIKTESPHA